MQRRVQLMQSLGWHACAGFEMDNDSEKWVSGSMTSWPCDALVIYESDALKLYLGGIASALRVDETDDPDLELVISVNKDDQLQRGCPHSWKTFFEERGLAILRYGGFDKGGLGVVWQYLEKIQECLTIWSALVREFEVWRPARASAAGQVVVLLHCFGGVNRSSAAALCLIRALDSELVPVCFCPGRHGNANHCLAALAAGAGSIGVTFP